MNGFSITAPTKKRTRLAPEDRREQLVLIGARMFAERPFNDVWIEAVAEEAGVSRGLVYHYFPNKRDFYAAIVRHGIEDTYRLTEPDESLPTAQWLPASINKFLDYVEANENAFRAVHRGQHSVDVEIQAVIREGHDKQVDRIANLVLPDDAKSPTLILALEGWMSLSNAIILDWLESRTIPRDQLIELLSGSLAGVIATALTLLDRPDQIELLMHLAPDVYNKR
ncbi:MAG: TetR/AcrR family transcriptional regulator [Solirubrobacterales bacterium]